MIKVCTLLFYQMKSLNFYNIDQFRLQTVLQIIMLTLYIDIFLHCQVDLRHMCEVEGSNVVDLGIDLSEFYMSVEWDILEVPAIR